jgi:peptidoglycan/LPS O-acetylase OafA/YrhL
MIQYRLEIDGLRAIAILPVLFFHAGWSIFAGGFVGVDIFFVISGYLITTIILQECDAGEFSILRFYERRIRRLLPALFVMLLLSSLAAYLLMSPARLVGFGKDMLATTGFVANVLLARQFGYFDEASAFKPLLHVWSLSVEEQYYLLMPLILWATLSWRWHNRVRIVAALLITSFSAALMSIDSAPVPSFYMLHTRAWELLAGSLCAFWLLRSPPRPSTPLSLLGGALILAAIFGFDKTTPFPSIWTLFPVCGSALVILFARDVGPVWRVLRFRPLVGIGLISYSLYLWHQPLLAFTRLNIAGEPTQSAVAIAIVIALPISYLSWRYVERPFRKGGKGHQLRSRAVFKLAGGTSLALVLIAALFIGTDGLLDRTNGKGQSYAVLKLDHRMRPNLGLGVNCTVGFTLNQSCTTSAQPDILVWGDSFAMHIARSVALARPNGQGIRQMTLAACGPYFDLAPTLDRQSVRRCIAFNDQIYQWLKSGSGIHTVVLSSSFGWMTDPSSKVTRRDGSIVTGGPRLAERALRDTVRRLHAIGLNVVIIAPPPNPGWELGQCLERRLWNTGEPYGCDYSNGAFSEPTTRAHNLLKSVGGDARIIWLKQIFCDPRLCHTARDGQMLYRDRAHLSVEGTKWLGRNPEFRAAVNKAIRRQTKTDIAAELGANQ